MTTIAPPNTLLIERWFSQLENGILNNVLTQQIAGHIRERNGFTRFGQTMTAGPSQSYSHPKGVSRSIGELAVIVAELVQNFGKNSRLSSSTRGLQQGDVLRYDIPFNEGWKLIATYNNDNTSRHRLRVELSGKDVEIFLPSNIHLLKDQHVVESAVLDEFGVVAFKDLESGLYTLQLHVGEQVIEAHGILIDNPVLDV